MFNVSSRYLRLLSASVILAWFSVILVGRSAVVDAAGKYCYGQALEAISRCRGRVLNPLPEVACRVVSPLQPSAWRDELCGFPDKRLTSFLMEGMQHGFRIGFRRGEVALSSTRRNMLSAEMNPEVVESYLAREVELGRVIGPLPSGTTVHVSRFGVIPKNRQPGKWRLIVDLSAPERRSVNDGISSDLCSLSYASVDDACSLIVRKGVGALLTKIDIESAYRILSVHPEDRSLLGMSWKGKLYVDSALPFGLRSAPLIFTALADALLWIFQKHGISDSIHYLDDFLFVGNLKPGECDSVLQLALELCGRLGVPVAREKLCGPATSLTFLGIEIDTVRMELRLPQEKLSRLRECIVGWLSRKASTKRELQSLIGQLQHACRVVRPGRTFLRRMIRLSLTVKEMHHHIRLNQSFRADLHWWSQFLESWNGVSILNCISQSPPFCTVTSDASGSWGCGAVLSSGEWFVCPWPESWAKVHITAKELFPIVVAGAVWGHRWLGRVVRFLTDNAAVVAIISSGSSKDDLVMRLLRSFFYIGAHHSLYVIAEHIAGKNNIADSLSRNNMMLFFQQVPYASASPTQVPSDLLDILLQNGVEGSSHSWTKLLTGLSEKE